MRPFRFQNLSVVLTSSHPLSALSSTDWKCLLSLAKNRNSPSKQTFTTPVVSLFRKKRRVNLLEWPHPMSYQKFPGMIVYFKQENNLQNRSSSQISYTLNSKMFLKNVPDPKIQTTPPFFLLYCVMRVNVSPRLILGPSLPQLGSLPRRS